MMVVDTSALVAIFEREPEAARFLRLIADADDVFVSAMQVDEIAIVMHRRHAGDAAERVWTFFRTHAIAIHPFDEAAARTATTAYQRFGKGTGHPAQLNLADCAAYALSRTLDAPLLFKGNDFMHTDIAHAA